MSLSIRDLTKVELLRRSNALRVQYQDFEMFGRTWILAPGVFSPVTDESTEIFTRAVLAHHPHHLIEVGAGAGVTGISAALELGTEVSATDISPQAVHNTTLNIEMHQVQDRVACYQGDLLSPLSKVENGITVFWNSNFIDAIPPKPGDLTDAFYDPGYRTHKRFFNQCAIRCDKKSIILLGFSSLGNSVLLEQSAGSAGWFVTNIEAESSRRSRGLEYQLFEFRRREQ